MNSTAARIVSDSRDDKIMPNVKELQEIINVLKRKFDEERKRLAQSRKRQSLGGVFRNIIRGKLPRKDYVKLSSDTDELRAMGELISMIILIRRTLETPDGNVTFLDGELAPLKFLYDGKTYLIKAPKDVTMASICEVFNLTMGLSVDPQSYTVMTENLVEMPSDTTVGEVVAKSQVKMD